MASVELAVAAVEDLDAIIASHSLAADTWPRVARSLRGLERFPLMGPALTGRWDGFRFVLGPWRWLVLVYVYLEAEDRVVVVTIQDGRSSAAETAARSSERAAHATLGAPAGSAATAASMSSWENSGSSSVPAR